MEVTPSSLQNQQHVTSSSNNSITYNDDGSRKFGLRLQDLQDNTPQLGIEQPFKMTTATPIQNIHQLMQDLSPYNRYSNPAAMMGPTGRSPRVLNFQHQQGKSPQNNSMGGGNSMRMMPGQNFSYIVINQSGNNTTSSDFQNRV